MRALERRITALERRPVPVPMPAIDDAKLEALRAKIRALKEKTIEPDRRPPQEQLAAEFERYAAAVRERERPDLIRHACDDSMNALHDKVHRMRVEELQKEIAAAANARQADANRPDEVGAAPRPAISEADNWV